MSASTLDSGIDVENLPPMRPKYLVEKSDWRRSCGILGSDPEHAFKFAAELETGFAYDMIAEERVAIPLYSCGRLGFPCWDFTGRNMTRRQYADSMARGDGVSAGGFVASLQSVRRQQSIHGTLENVFGMDEKLDAVVQSTNAAEAISQAKNYGIEMITVPLWQDKNGVKSHRNKLWMPYVNEEVCPILIGEPVPTSWKEDISRAFRRLPIQQLHLWMAWVVWMYNDVIYTAQHKAMPFGATASVSAWSATTSPT